MKKISDKTPKKRRKKVKKPIRAKVQTILDVVALKNDGVSLPQRYHKEYVSYNKLCARTDITVCKRWRKSFENFLNDMGPKPFNRYLLSRLNKSSLFNKANCQWVRGSNLKNVMSFDPGVQNFAACWIKNNRVVEAFVLNNTLEYVRQDSFEEDVEHFTREFCDIIDKRKPKTIIIERFVPRRFSTGSAESINMAIGIMLSACSARSIPITLVMSSTWKNALKKHANLDLLYKEAKSVLKLKKLMPHTVDAMSMASYILNNRKFDAATVAWIRKNMKNLKTH